MKKVLVLFVSIFVMCDLSQANCSYLKQLETEAFPIGVMLSWSTSWEENTAVFFVERSQNGVDFETVGKVNSAGHSLVIKKYTFLDNKPQSAGFYRLRQTDNDGSFRFSETVKNKHAGGNIFVVAGMTSPSTSDQFTAYIESAESGELKYELRDVSGKLLFWATKMVKSGKNEISIGLADYNSGIYKLKISFGTEEETLVLQKNPDQLQKENRPYLIGASGEKIRK